MGSGDKMSDSRINAAAGNGIMADTDINSRFSEIYDSTNKHVLAFITAKCGNTADINDIFQETYMELYQRLQKRGADYVKDGKAFVLRIAKNKIARHYTLLKKLQIFVSMTVKNDDNETEEIEISDAEINSFLTEDFIVDKIMLNDIKKFIRQKQGDIEKIFYFFYDMGLSIPEIAQALSLSESSVKNKLYRTIKEIRNILEKGG
jgi:RNA polymerase sigma-70 factor (ECF subfamily)